MSGTNDEEDLGGDGKRVRKHPTDSVLDCECALHALKKEIEWPLRDRAEE